MRKQDMLDQLKVMLDEMYPVWAKYGIEIKFFKLPEHAELTHSDTIREAFLWIRDIYMKEFMEYKSIRRLCSEEIWEGYELNGDCDDLREVIALRKAVVDLKKACLQQLKPELFKKGKKKDHEKLQQAD